MITVVVENKLLRKKRSETRALPVQSLYYNNSESAASGQRKDECIGSSEE